jgi:tripartite-type tricarboxylate transporter receptor subunit TctC
VREFVALAKTRPGQLNYASAGIGSANHLTMELFKVATKIDLVHVSYKGGGPALIDLLGGHVFTIFVTIPPSLPHVKAGRLRALGISSAKRSAVLPDLPTVAESGVPGFAVYEWQGVLVPTGTPRSIIERLHKEIVAILALPDVKERIAGLGADVIGSGPEELAAHIKSELATWARVIRQAGIQVS